MQIKTKLLSIAGIIFIVPYVASTLSSSAATILENTARHLFLRGHRKTHEKIRRNLNFGIIPLRIFVPSAIPTASPSFNNLENNDVPPSSSPSLSQQPTYMMDSNDSGDGNVVVTPPLIQSIPSESDWSLDLDASDVNADMGYMFDISREQEGMGVNAEEEGEDVEVIITELSVPIEIISASSELSSMEEAAEIQMFIRLSTHEGYGRRPAAWTLYHTQYVPGEQFSQLIQNDPNANVRFVQEISDFDPIAISFGTMALYVHCKNNCRILTTETTESITGDVAYSNSITGDSIISLHTGTAKGGNPGIAFQQNKENADIWSLSGANLKYMIMGYNGVVSSAFPSMSSIDSEDDLTVLSLGEGVSSLQSGSYSGYMATSGIMFDIHRNDYAGSNSGNLLITSLAIHTDSTRSDLPIIVYYKYGSYEGYSRRPNAWSTIFEGTVQGMGPGAATPIGDLDSFVSLNMGESISLYVSINDHTYNEKLLSNGDGVVEMEEYASNSDMSISVGIGKTTKRLFASNYQSSAFDGTIYYEFSSKAAGISSSSATRNRCRLCTLFVVFSVSAILRTAI